MKKDILVTGGTGLVGKRLAREVIKVYDKSRILFLVKDSESKFEISARKMLDRLKVDYIKIDLTKPSTLSDIPKRPKLVIHMAANTETLEDNHDVNDKGTMNLIKALGNINRNTHFIHLSTVAFLASRLDCSVPLDEDSEPYPTNEYSRTKLRAEKHLISKCKKLGFKLDILRVNTIYGENVRPDSLFDSVNKMAKRKALASRINWPGKTSIIHVDDVVSTIVSLSELKRSPGNPEVFIIYAESYTLAEIFRLAYKNLNLDYNEIRVPVMVWWVAKYARRLIPYFENLAPGYLYNWIWRLGLVVDHAVYCETDKLKITLKKWRPKKLESNLDQVFY